MNTFTEENLREEWYRRMNGYPPSPELAADWFLSKFKAYQSHLISEGEKMKSHQKIDNGHDCYEANCDYCENYIKDEAITAYQAIIRGEQ